MIRDTLQKLVFDLEGCRGVVLLGADGMPVDGVVVDQAADTELVAAGVADLLRRSGRFSTESGGGDLLEVTLQGDRLTVVARPVGRDFGLLALLDPEGNLGRARLELRRAAASIALEL